MSTFHARDRIGMMFTVRLSTLVASPMVQSLPCAVLELPRWSVIVTTMKGDFAMTSSVYVRSSEPALMTTLVGSSSYTVEYMEKPTSGGNVG